MAHEGERRAKPAKPPYRPPPGGDQGGTGGAAAMLAAITAAIPGIPSNIASVIGQILAQDPTQAGQDRAFSYLRGQDWFNQTFVGFNAGASNGLWGSSLGDIANYRGWRTRIRDTFSQNYGRDASSDELNSFASSGYDAGTIEQIGQGHATAAANAADWNYLTGAFDTGQVTGEEKEAYGQLLAGRSSDLGLRVQARIQAAMAKANAAFGGVLAGQGGALPTPGLQKLPDVGA